MELITLALFSAGLLLCVATGHTVLWALAVGYGLFFFYALRQGHAPREILSMSLEGVRAVGNILVTFVLIGSLTAAWRASGTIAAIVAWASALLRPSAAVVMAFLLNCLVSFLTGTAFGTSATMGVVSMTMASAMGVSPAVAGGAILSGIYFGDRCSPVSTSALLVASTTGTDLYQNVKAMAKRAVVPFLAACLVYAALGLLLPHSEGAGVDVTALFSAQFRLGLPALLPAVVILVMSLLRLGVKQAMLCSTVCALAVCLAYQGMEASAIPALLLTGYRCPDATLSAMLDGGGVTSMAKTAAIVAISSAYSGIFRGTPLLSPVKERLSRLAKRTTPFAAACCAGCLTSMVGCNQTLAILLSDQLCDGVLPDPQQRALALEDTAAVIAAIVPWSIAGAVPMATVGAPTVSMALACYLYFLPLWGLLRRRNA
jgi:NhaC family Na+:H+ antiporter